MAGLQVKTIKKVLKKKTDRLLESITDQKLRADLHAGLLVTGGSLASMLIGEPVNDFDIYFKDHELAHRVAVYYVEKFRREIGTQYTVDVSIDKDQDPPQVKINVRSAGVVGQTPDQSESDENLEAVGLGDFLDRQPKQKSEKEAYRPVFLSPNAISLSGKVQLITRFTGSAEQIHQNFDFIHCTASWDRLTDELHVSKEALMSMMSRRLFYTGSRYPLCSLIRTRKFIERGWKINAGQYVKMAYQIHPLNLNDLKVMKEQLVGVDSSYFAAFINRLHEEQKWDNLSQPGERSDYLSDLIDQIF